jgi:ribosomal-protein-alanine N-acetyltransferase
VSGLAIRLATTRDLRRMLAIEQVSFDEPWTEGLLRSELELRSSRRYSVATQGRAVIGFLGLMAIDEDVHVNTIATDPAHRSNGVATALLLEGIDGVLAMGGRHLTLEVAATNEGAQALYRRFGLAPVGVRRGYYAGGVDAIVMWCRDLDSEGEVARRAEIAASLASRP